MVALTFTESSRWATPSPYGGGWGPAPGRSLTPWRWPVIPAECANWHISAVWGQLVLFRGFARWSPSQIWGRDAGAGAIRGRVKGREI
jgi:hypothetical protein